MHIFTVGRSAISFKLKVSGKLEIFSIKSTVKPLYCIYFTVKLVKGLAKFQAIKLTIV